MNKVLKGTWEQIIEPDEEQWALVWIGSQSLINGGTFNIPNIQPNRPTRYTFSIGLTAEAIGHNGEDLGTQVVIPAGESVTGANTLLSGSANFTDIGDWNGVDVAIYIAAPDTLQADIERRESTNCWSPDNMTLYGTLTLRKIEQL